MWINSLHWLNLELINFHTLLSARIPVQLHFKWRIRVAQLLILSFWHKSHPKVGYIQSIKPWASNGSEVRGQGDLSLIMSLKNAFHLEICLLGLVFLAINWQKIEGVSLTATLIFTNEIWQLTFILGPTKHSWRRTLSEADRAMPALNSTKSSTRQSCTVRTINHDVPSINCS